MDVVYLAESIDACLDDMNISIGGYDKVKELAEALMISIENYSDGCFSDYSPNSSAKINDLEFEISELKNKLKIYEKRRKEDIRSASLGKAFLDIDGEVKHIR